MWLMPFSLFGNLCRSVSKPRQHPARPRLALESLEDRSLLSSSAFSSLEIAPVMINFDRQSAAQTVASSKITTVGGNEFAGVVAELAANDVSRMHASIDWGDGTRSPGSIVLTSQGDFSVFGRHTYASSGSYVLTITVTLDQDAQLVASPATPGDVIYLKSAEFVLQAVAPSEVMLALVRVTVEESFDNSPPPGGARPGTGEVPPPPSSPGPPTASPPGPVNGVGQLAWQRLPEPQTYVWLSQQSASASKAPGASAPLKTIPMTPSLVPTNPQQTSGSSMLPDRQSANPFPDAAALFDTMELFSRPADSAAEKEHASAGRAFQDETSSIALVADNPRGSKETATILEDGLPEPDAKIDHQFIAASLGIAPPLAAPAPADKSAAAGPQKQDQEHSAFGWIWVLLALALCRRNLKN
jgi:hypothetical protein